MSLQAKDIQDRIENEYVRRGEQRGWRLLASPWSTVYGSDVAFIGLQPGGAAGDDNHSQLATSTGSAYLTESWAGSEPGRSRLQLQVQALFKRIGVDPAKVLAGNLVPFRSPDAASYRDMSGAIEFGESIWRDILAESKPALVVTMSENVMRAICRIGRVYALQEIPCHWGKICIRLGAGPDFRLVALPHLSRFGIMTRVESNAALSVAFP